MSENKKHLAKMFHKKFEAIPDEKWCTIYLDNGKGQHCALGHLGEEAVTTRSLSKPEAKQLGELFQPLTATMQIYGMCPAVIVNDGGINAYQQPTPKARILAALEDIIRQ